MYALGSLLYTKHKLGSHPSSKHDIYDNPSTNNSLNFLSFYCFPRLFELSQQNPQLNPQLDEKTFLKYPIDEFRIFDQNLLVEYSLRSHIFDEICLSEEFLISLDLILSLRGNFLDNTDQLIIKFPGHFSKFVEQHFQFVKKKVQLHKEYKHLHSVSEEWKLDDKQSRNLQIRKKRIKKKNQITFGLFPGK